MNGTGVLVGTFVMGLLLHVVLKWSDWKDNGGRDKNWNDYWRDHLANNISSAVIAIVLGFAWLSGTVSDMLAAAGIEFPVNFGTSGVAGYMFDSVGRNLMSRVKSQIEK